MAGYQDSDQESIWAGVIWATRAVVVYAPELQFPGMADVNVYSVERDLVRRFTRPWIRGNVRKIQDHSSETALARFASWKSAHAEEFKQRDMARIVRESSETVAAAAISEAANAKAIEQHRKFMKLSGLEYPGTIRNSPSGHRITHCWRCKGHLDSNINVSCSACRWIICGCGACGCGR